MAEPTDLVFEDIDSVIIRFAGDSGDGMQLTGTQFSDTAAVFGNDISTMPDFPAEIRAPAGTLAGVSGFQVNFSSKDILTPGDAPEILVAMNPAALKANLSDLQPGGRIIVNTDSFTAGNLKKANYESNPLEDDSLKGYEVHKVPLTTLNRKALEDIEGLNTRDIDRCQNFFALGLTFWIYDRSLDTSMIKLLWGRKRIDAARAMAMTMMPGWQQSGLGIVLIDRLVEAAKPWGLKNWEFSWVLESNKSSRGTLERLETRRSKTYRIYDRAL
jgi:2-oxoglutarate ferredoxin oxidoreductase subunit alpha